VKEKEKKEKLRVTKLPFMHKSSQHLFSTLFFGCDIKTEGKKRIIITTTSFQHMHRETSSTSVMWDCTLGYKHR